MHDAEPAGPSHPSRWRRGASKAIAGLVAIVVAVGGVLGVQAFVLVDAVAQIQERSGTLIGMASRLDFPGVEVALREVADDAAIAAAASSGPLWDLAAVTPVVGDDLRAVGQAVAVLDELASASNDAYAATGLADGVGALLPRDGRFDMDAFGELVGALDAIDTASADAAARIAEIDRAGLLGPVRGNIDTIARLLESIPQQLETARTALAVVGAALGADGPRSVLVVLRDSAQDWASGGAPLAVAELDVVEGRVGFVRSAAASEFVNAGDPVEEDPSEWAQLSTMQLATVPAFAPLASALAGSWEQRFGEDVDLVVAIDTVALESIAEFAGADTAAFPESGGWAGASAQQQQAALAEGIDALLDGAGGASGTLDLAAELFGGRRIQVWSAHSAEMALIGAYPTVSGDVEPTADRITILVDGAAPSATGGSELAVELAVCAEESTVRVEFEFRDAAADATVWVIGPTGAESVDVASSVTLDGAPVVELAADAGSTAEVTFRVGEARTDYVLIAQPRLLGPLVESATACG